MTTFFVSWDDVTVDDTGAPVNETDYNIYVDGVLHSTAGGPFTSANVTITGSGPHTIEVSAVGPGGEGAKSVVDFVVGAGGLAT